MLALYLVSPDYQLSFTAVSSDYQLGFYNWVNGTTLTFLSDVSSQLIRNWY